MRVINGNTATTADEADVRFTVIAHRRPPRVRPRDYTGQLQVNPTLRITDRYNGPGETGTGQDPPLRGHGAVHGDGGTSTSARPARSPRPPTPSCPGPCARCRRSIWELGQVQVFDGGPDGVASTTPNTLFAMQGVFVP